MERVRDPPVLWKNGGLRVVSPPLPPPGQGGPPTGDPNAPGAILASFIEKDVHRFVAFLVENYRWLAPEETLRFENLVQQAWEELGPAFEASARQLRNLTEPDLRALEAHGLTGAQLNLKIETLKIAFSEVDLTTPLRERFLNDPNPLPHVQASREELSHLSDGVDNVLGSMASFVPGAGAISEVKHHVGWLLKWPWKRHPR